MTNAPANVQNNAATPVGVVPVAQRVQPPPAERSLLLRHGFSLLPDERRSPEAARIWRQTLTPKQPAAPRDLTPKPNNF